VTHVPAGQLGISESLRTFVGELTAVRRPILELVREVARELPSGAIVLDVGAGDAPYRELFEHTNYRTLEWHASEHEGAEGADILASADAVPVDDESCDAVLLTEVLEHIPEPLAVLRELRRILRPGERLVLTVPFVWQLHELPHDYYRFTDAGLRSLLDRAGFVDVEVHGRNDCFTTVAELLRNLDDVMGRDATDGLDDRREGAGRALAELADQVAGLAPLDVKRIFPLGYAATAARS
jgi:SAM-dependent methyltransferase